MKGRVKMNDAVKIKEPETAATESGSEQETCNDIPADIVTPSVENVKPPHSLTYLASEMIKFADQRAVLSDDAEGEEENYD